MKDNGVVLSAGPDYARVKIECAAVCHDCSAHSLCIGSKNEGILSVKNPLSAGPGDCVSIDVPENTYSRALIVMFGGLLIAALIGMGLGWLSSRLFSFDSDFAAPAGFFLGIGCAAVWLTGYFRRHNQQTLYPKIIDIIKKGDRHE